MHIPDSAISPASSIAATTAMIPVWAAAARRLRQSLGTRQIPLLAVGAAFCFTIMMFNIPVPGGTTVHPVGGVLLAILLGPWAATLGVTVALAIQALFFADGGVFAIGANAFTMAFAMPFAGYFTYRVAAGASAPGSPRRAFASALGAYVGVNVAAALTAVILGIQPALFHDAAGRGLYFPFPLAVTVPALMAAHLVVAGPAEAVVTAIAVRYLIAAGIPLYRSPGQDTPQRERRELVWVGLLALAALTPLGLLARGDAWGEWSLSELAARAGYAPLRLAAAEAHGWRGLNLLPDYLSGRGAVYYVLAAAVGIALVALSVRLFARLLARDVGTRRRGDAQTQGRGDTGEERRHDAELPEWLLAPESVDHSPAASRGSLGFAEKTLAGIAESARTTLCDEEWARRPGLLQGLHPNVKVIGLVACVVAVSALRRWEVVTALYGIATALAVLSRLPAAAFQRRVWLGVPLFAGAVVLPCALNVVAPGPALLVLSRTPFIAVTTSGLAAAGLFALRVGAAVAFALLLTMTTRWNDLLQGLRGVFVPRPFIAVLAMAYRYLVVLMQSTSDMFVARRSRTIGHVAESENRRFLGGALGALFGRTLAMTDEVHAAMLSRGWTGEARTLRRAGIRASDLLWLAALLSCAATAVLLERLRG